MEGLGRVFGNHFAAEGSLDEFELVQRQAGDAAVILVFDGVALAERRAQNADGIGAMSLNFEMNRWPSPHDGYRIPYINHVIKNNVNIYMATFETANSIEVLGLQRSIQI